MNKRIAWYLFLFVAFSGPLQAQLTHSPFSRFGLGDVFDPVSTRYFSMGGTGLAMYDAAVVNRMNPASYGDLKLTSLDFNAYGTARALRTADSANLSPAGGLHNVSFGFSSRKNFGIVFGLAPFSAANYRIETRDSVLADTTFEKYTTTYRADGGMNQFYIGFGVRLWQKLNLGINASYAFGNTNYRWSTDFDDANYDPVIILRKSTLTGLQPSAGAQFGDTLRFSRMVNLIDELDKKDKNMKEELKMLDKEDSALLHARGNLSKKESKLNARKALYEAEEKQINAAIEPLMKDERAHEKEIGKLQDRRFALEKKKKRIDQTVKSDLKEWQREKNAIAARREAILKEQAISARKREEVKKGERDSTFVKTNKYLARIGVVWQPASTLKGDYLTTFTNLTIVDTTLNSVLDGQVKVPMRVGGGFSFGVANKWVLGADVRLQSWSGLQYFNDNNTLQNSLRISLGGEYIPRYNSLRFADRIAWRAGAYYEKTSLAINGSSVNDIGITFGVGLPVGRMLLPGAVSRINLGLAIGSRGSVTAHGLQENYIALRLGLNLNDVWFLRPRID